MALLRFGNGSDLKVAVSAQEALALLKSRDDGFVEFEASGTLAFIRPSAVLAVMETEDRRTTGFRPAHEAASHHHIPSPTERVEQ